MIRQIALNSDGRLLASCAADKRVCLWDSDTGHLVGELLGYDEDVQSVQFSSDGQLLATGDAKGKVRLWDVASRKLLRLLDATELWLLHRLQDVGGVRFHSLQSAGTLWLVAA